MKITDPNFPHTKFEIGLCGGPYNGQVIKDWPSNWKYFPIVVDGKEIGFDRYQLRQVVDRDTAELLTQEYTHVP